LICNGEQEMIMVCENCGQPMETEYVDARFIRHSGGACTCVQCEQCAELYHDDDTEAHAEHQACGG
jgi:RNase P subunit RPR2